MLKQLREQVLEANLEVVRRGLVLYTFGNVSGISREDNLVAIKPSGVPYERMKADDIVVTDLDGRIVWGELRPSSDLDTHLHLYKAFPEIGGVVHTHSERATASSTTALCTASSGVLPQAKGPWPATSAAGTSMASRLPKASVIATPVART
jgi:L-ribulose-5-phosphate 4-epimerase